MKPTSGARCGIRRGYLNRPKGAKPDRSNKIGVVAMVERGGDVRYRMMDRVTSEQLGSLIIENADLTCRLMTDESAAYTKIGRAFRGGHHTTKHGAREYVRPGTDIHS